MSEANVIRHARGNFTQVPNELLRDERLSLEAKAIYCIMYSKPDGWLFFKGQLVSESTNGRTSFDSGLKELLASGWVDQSGGGQGDGGKWRGYSYVLKENRCMKSAAENPQRENRSGQSPPIKTEEVKQTEQDLVPPSGSPAKTKVSRRATRLKSLEQHLAESTTFRADCIEYAVRKHGVDTVYAGEQLTKFTNHHIGKGTRWVDWNRAWWNWCSGFRATSQQRPSSAAERNARDALLDAAVFHGMFNETGTNAATGSAGAARSDGEGDTGDRAPVDVAGW